MRRCLQLAQLGAGTVSPNPMVGALLYYDGKIIAEGWHAQYGGPHAEVNAIRSAPTELVRKSVLFCTLEPCAHFGKTPPCAQLIVDQHIPSVVVAAQDPNPLVAGRGIQILKNAGIAVETGILQAEAIHQNRAFFTWILEKRPFIILKWAQSADGKLSLPNQQTPITGSLAKRLVHRWRYESDAILVGTKTAMVDNPQLNSRHYRDKPLCRIALDLDGKLPEKAHIFDGSQPTWILGPVRPNLAADFIPVDSGQWIPQLLTALYQSGKAILFVEGGANVLNQFLEAELWDELRILQGTSRLGIGGISAPAIPASAVKTDTGIAGADQWEIYTKGG